MATPYYGTKLGTVQAEPGFFLVEYLSSTDPNLNPYVDGAKPCLTPVVAWLLLEHDPNADNSKFRGDHLRRWADPICPMDFDTYEGQVVLTPSGAVISPIEGQWDCLEDYRKEKQREWAMVKRCDTARANAQLAASALDE